MLAAAEEEREAIQSSRHRRSGVRLREPPEREPVWIGDTPPNRLAYEAVGQESHLPVKGDPTRQPTDWLNVPESPGYLAFRSEPDFHRSTRR